MSKRKICDIHAHLVPAVDDGASDFDMAIKMLYSAYQQGVRHIICTSHSGCNTKLYFNNLSKLRKGIKNQGINIELYSGCEIYCYTDNIKKIIAKLQNREIPTVNDTNYVLIEFDPYEYASEIAYCIMQLHQSGYKVILAHTERYLNLFENYELIPMLQDIGCLFQINAYSIQDTTDIYNKAFARKLLKEQRVSFIGSDAHRTNHRPYLIQNGIEYIYQNCDIEYAQNICYNNAKYILKISD